MLRLLFVSLLALICILPIQANKALHDRIHNRISALKKSHSDTLEVRLNVLKDHKCASELWDIYKKFLNKNYATREKDRHHMNIFTGNLRKIIAANHHREKNRYSYRQEINRFGDIDEKEFLQTYTGIKLDRNAKHSHFQQYSQYGNRNEKHKHIKMPPKLDYRRHMNPIEDQGKCGSCYAFATTATIEGVYSLKKRKKVILSKQNIVDCVMNYGCHGGWFAQTYDYIKSHHGLQTASSYPYHAARRTCVANRRTVESIKGYAQVRPNDEEEMKAMLNRYGPLTVGIDATPLRFFGSGSSNILETPHCSKTINHAVVIVGYGKENGRDYWLARNSWGTKWGDHGYFKIARNKDGMCGIATYVYYVIV